MPATYNGVGTHYYGKNNLQTRTGACRSCGRTVQLQSYDTRLWFVFLYIPIIPLEGVTNQFWRLLNLLAKNEGFKNGFIRVGVGFGLRKEIGA